MDEFGPLPDELPDFKFSQKALVERDRFVSKAGRLLTVAAVYLAQGRESVHGKVVDAKRDKVVKVERDDVVEAARFLLVPSEESGIPWLNEFVESLLYQSCFLSHSTKDRAFCKRLYKDLKENGVSCWYFPEDATPGSPMRKIISSAIQMCDRFLLVCSEDSRTSRPVSRELNRALEREDNEHHESEIDRPILFPITIDDYIYDNWKHERRTDVLGKVVGDFRGWKRSRSKYDAAFRKLLQSLQGAVPPQK
jgi:TIR domain-containing protein